MTNEFSAIQNNLVIENHNSNGNALLGFPKRVKIGKLYEEKKNYEEAKSTVTITKTPKKGNRVLVTGLGMVTPLGTSVE